MKAMDFSLRELRYVRLKTTDLEGRARFFQDVVGLQPAGSTSGQSNRLFRSDSSAYSVFLDARSESEPAIALTIGSMRDLVAIQERLQARGIASSLGSAEDCGDRLVKAFLACQAPNGVNVEFVLRPMTSGWRYFASRDAGITGLQSVSLHCTDVAANERFWTEALGGVVSDWAGDTAYVRIDDGHHRIALHPSVRDGLMGITFGVEDLNNVMQNFYFLQKQQLPIVHGPGHDPASGRTFVVTSDPEGVLIGFANGMAHGVDRLPRPPRQFPHIPLSYCSWGSHTLLPEFGAD